MLVHRLLDVVFRTLDAIDALRARVDRVLGTEPQPPSGWPPVVDGAPGGRPVDAERARDASGGPSDAAAVDARTPESTSEAKDAQEAAPAKTKAKAPKSNPKASSTTPKGGGRKAAGSARKGSVDRSGRDFDSPRARAVQAWVVEHKHPIVVADAAIDGKRTLARVLWAVGAAEDAGSEQGLTAADVSALLWSVANVEVFATNVARAFRDEAELFAETIPDGRSKRYKLTQVGRQRLAEVATR